MNSLETLRDVHLPSQPGLWPPAPGWWALAVLVVGMLGIALWLAVHRYRARRYRREALAELGEMERGTVTLARLIRLVRRTGMSAPGNTRWSTLDSGTLLERLDAFSRYRISSFLARDSEAPGDLYKALSDRIYREEDELTGRERDVTVEAVRRWIRRHRREDLC